MSKINWTKLGLGCGIAVGIVFIVAFLSSQIIYPLIFPKEKTEVPDIVKMNFSTARKQLSKLGLHVVVSDSVWSETDKIETILEQDPQPGVMIEAESSVYVRLSRGSKQVAVPHVLDQTFHSAIEILHGIGLRAVVADSTYQSNYKINHVYKCVPAAGSKVDKNSTVRLYISKGEEPIIEQPATDPDNTQDRDMQTDRQR